MGTSTRTILPVETERDWDIRPTCEVCGQVMCEGGISPAKAVDGFIYTWWCPSPGCAQAHAERYTVTHRDNRANAADFQPEKILPAFGIDPFYFGATLESIKGYDAIVRDAREWAKNPTGNLFLSGGTGRGKTHLAVAILREQIRAGHSNMLFRYIPDLILELKNTFDSGAETHITERDIIDRYSEYRLLVLDDLGVEKSTEYAVATLETIVDKRLRNMFPTIVTSNLTIGEVETEISPRLASRLASGKVWRMEGKDWRRKR